MRGKAPQTKIRRQAGGSINLVCWVGLVAAVKVFTRDLLEALRARCDT